MVKDRTTRFGEHVPKFGWNIGRKNGSSPCGGSHSALYDYKKRCDMKKGIEYRDVAKEIVKVLVDYEATVKDTHYILGWLEDEMMIQSVREAES